MKLPRKIKTTLLCAAASLAFILSTPVYATPPGSGWTQTAAVNFTSMPTICQTVGSKTPGWLPTDYWNNHYVGDEDTYYCFPGIDTGYMPFSITSYSGVNVLSITADTAPADMDTDGKTYVSGCLSKAAGANYSTDIQSSTPFSQTYGYFEARCKLPTAAGSSKGMWPAFWMMPADGSSTAEYDIFEVLGNAPTAIWQTAHWNSYGNQLAYKYSGPDTSTAFHTYGFQWDANNIRWFVDGILTQTQPNYYNSAMYPMFDLAVGGSWPGEPDDSTVFPASMLIKYFYAYSGGTVTDLILDNTATTGVTITGTWTSSTSTKGYYGSNYLHDGNTGQGNKSIRYTPTLSTSGSYQVFARWTADANRATNVPISITSTSGTKTVYVNEQSNNGVWVYLGTYAFDSGTTGNLLISNTGANGYVTADAVRFFK